MLFALILHMVGAAQPVVAPETFQNDTSCMIAGQLRQVVSTKAGKPIAYFECCNANTKICTKFETN
jgi:hypothetical protein